MVRKRQRKTPILFLIVVVLLFGVISKVFVVKSIDIKLNNAGCVSEQQVKSLLSLQGKNILLTDFNNLDNKFRSKYICVKDINFTKQLPDKILVQVNGRTGVAVVRTISTEAATSANLLDLSTPSSSGSATPSAQLQILDGYKGIPYLVDEEGIIFAQADEGVNLPTLLLSGVGLDFGKGLKNDLIKKAVVIIQKLKDFNLEIKQAIIYSNKYLLIDGKTRVQFNLEKDVNIQLASLQLILDKAKIDSENMEIIDLRFDKPVVKIPQKEKK